MTSNSITKTILITPLNWGLGHATRCIPIIKALQENNFIPLIASDGQALEILKKEFPYIKTLELPSYQIEYAKNGIYFKWKLLKNCTKTISAIWKEQKLIEKWIADYEIDGIISDNRLGCYSKKIPSVYITHQLNVLSGNTTWLTSKLHQRTIKKYRECWIPDVENNPNLTGVLSHQKNYTPKLKYIGPLSRMTKKELPIQFDLMVILSGPEPQRGLLEEKLIQELIRYKGAVLFIKGKIEKEQKKEQIKNILFYNFMNSRQLEQAYNESNLILCRSGYTTIMDLVALEKKAFFIPTPGQYEQIYLAQKLKTDGLAPFANQDDFKIENLFELKNYKGFEIIKNEIDWKNAFEVFK